MMTIDKKSNSAISNSSMSTDTAKLRAAALTIANLREALDIACERIRQLEETITPVNNDKYAEYARLYGFTKTEARVFAAIKNKNDKMASKNFLISLFENDDSGKDGNTLLNVYIYRIRKKILDFPIEIINAHNIGYYIRDKPLHGILSHDVKSRDKKLQDRK